MLLDDSQLKTVPYSPICYLCDHLVDGYKMKCKAFKIIPEQIWNGDDNHTDPYPGDKGIRFTPKRL